MGCFKLGSNGVSLANFHKPSKQLAKKTTSPAHVKKTPLSTTSNQQTALWLPGASRTPNASMNTHHIAWGGSQKAMVTRSRGGHWKFCGRPPPKAMPIFRASKLLGKVQLSSWAQRPGRIAAACFWTPQRSSLRDRTFFRWNWLDLVGIIMEVGLGEPEARKGTERENTVKRFVHRPLYGWNLSI